jgi:hypothetical protein
MNTANFGSAFIVYKRIAIEVWGNQASVYTVVFLFPAALSSRVAKKDFQSYEDIELSVLDSY